MRRTVALLLVSLALVATACGDDTQPANDTSFAGDAATTTTAAATSTAPPADAITTSGGETTTSALETTTTTAVAAKVFPITVGSDAGPTTIEAPPVRIAALSATHVEMLYAIGAGERVIAVDLFSNHPAEAATKPALDSFNLNVEEVIATDPDLVVLSFDPVGAVEALEAVGIPTLLLGTATTLQSSYDQMKLLGSATGLEAEATQLVEQVAADIDAAVAAVGDRAAGITYYHEADPFTFYTPTSESFIGQIYGLFAMENIADAAPDAAGQTFPQLTPEYIVDADPEMIFSTDPSGDGTQYEQREGWGAMQAVASGDVYFLDPDIASRWGPRLADLVAAIATALIDHVG